MSKTYTEKENHFADARNMVEEREYLDESEVGEVLLQIAQQVEQDYGCGGLSEGLYFNFAAEVAKRYTQYNSSIEEQLRLESRQLKLDLERAETELDKFKKLYADMTDLYFKLADSIAAGSESPEHLRQIATFTRIQRDAFAEKCKIDVFCECEKCKSYAYNKSLCEYTRLIIPFEKWER